jgi:aspartate/methionine/tyrosine aminotransferase
MVPGPVQAAAVAAWLDDVHVDEQRARYAERIETVRAALKLVGVDAPAPEGAFYVWAPAPDGDAWGLTQRLAEQAGALVSPGEFYGESGAGYVRVAVVQPDDRIALVAERLEALRAG